MTRRTIRSEVWEGENIPTRARVILDSGAALATSDASSFSIKVYDLSAGGQSDPTSTVYSTSNTATSTVLYNAYRTSGWTQDSTGYNVEAILGPNNFATNGGHTYRIVLTFETGSYGAIPIVHDVNVRSTLAT